MAIEVGEHVPPQAEATLLRNLHATNCRGIILSWALLRTRGHAHVNNHNLSYVERQLASLGYFQNAVLTRVLRSRFMPMSLAPSMARWQGLGLRLYSYDWIRRTAAVYERFQPACNADDS
jgi:hypothetical protein